MAEREVILLVVEEAVEDDARSRRDRDHQAFIPVPDVPDADILHSLRTAMGWPGELDDLQVARYHRVCIVAFPTSPVRTWVTAFFAAEAPWLIETGGLSWCLPPFDPRHVRPIKVANASLADQWQRLQPDPPAPAPSGPKLHPGSDRPGSGGWWSGPQVVVAAGDPTYHLRVQEGRRSFCGRPAKDLDHPEPAVDLEEIPEHRRCPGCTRLWWEEIRPQREWEKRDVFRRREATEGLLAAFDDVEAINRTIAEAPDWPAAHAALTAEPFRYTDLQAFHILTFPAGRRTAEGRSDLEAEQADLRSWLARLDAFFAERPKHEPAAESAPE